MTKTAAIQLAVLLNALNAPQGTPVDDALSGMSMVERNARVGDWGVGWDIAGQLETVAPSDVIQGWCIWQLADHMIAETVDADGNTTPVIW